MIRSKCLRNFNELTRRYEPSDIDNHESSYLEFRCYLINFFKLYTAKIPYIHIYIRKQTLMNC